MNVPAPHSETLSEAPTSALIQWLDRTIVVLMVAILLTLSWPVSVALWSARRPASPATPPDSPYQRGHGGTQWNPSVVFVEVAASRPL